MWFESPERNTLRPQENRVILLKPRLAHVSLSRSFPTRCLPGLFIAQGQTVTLRPRAQQVTPRWLKPYTIFRVLMARSS
jgi:hypothetical protein